MRSVLSVIARLGLLSLVACNSSLAYYGPDDKPLPTDPDGTTPADDTAVTTDPETTTTETTETTTTETTTTETTTTETTTEITDTGTPVGPWIDGDPASPPPYTAPPPQNIGSNCAAVGGIVPGLDDDEVDVLSHDSAPEIRTLTSSVSGWYDLYDEELSHEESGEWNESAMVRIVNTGNPTGHPVLANCDSNWVAVDPDNYSDIADDLLYLGTFWFEVGSNELQLEHLCPRVRAGLCTDLEFLDDSDTTCASGDGNSAHLDGERLCMVPVAL